MRGRDSISNAKIFFPGLFLIKCRKKKNEPKRNLVQRIEEKLPIETLLNGHGLSLLNR